jgi:hypothetical protein
MTEGQTTNPPSLSKLLLITVGAGIAATILTVLIVLPAEFGRDPTGFGRLTGLDALAPEHEHTVEAVPGVTSPAQFSDTPFRSDTMDIPLVPKGDNTGHHQLEYKVRMKPGQTIVYAWEVEGAAEGEFFSDLHAETDGPDVKVIEFKQETALRGNGSLIAPIDGVHGWYWQNKSPNKVVVRLKLSGFYDLIPPGETGNKAGILPSPPASSLNASTTDE